MKSLLKFFLIFTFILLTSAFFAPLLFKFLPFKFERIFNRLIMTQSLLAVFLWVRGQKGIFVQYGLAWRKNSAALFLKSFLLVYAVLFSLTLLKMAMGSIGWQPQGFGILKISGRVLGALGAGLLIGVFEEFFFRGFIFTTFRRQCAWNLWAALIATSLIYSLAHFLGDKNPFIGPAPTFFDSLKLVKAPFESFKDLKSIWPGALGLFIFGVVLNGVVIRTRSLYPAIGLHAGAVFFIKSNSLFVDAIKSNSILIGTPKGYDGLLGWAFLLLLGWIVRKVFKNESQVNESAHD